VIARQVTHPDRNMRAITDRPYSIVCLLISLPELVKSEASVDAQTNDSLNTQIP
jgi:hypothetical protein